MEENAQARERLPPTVTGLSPTEGEFRKYDFGLK